MKLSSGNQAQPQCVFAQESSAFWFPPSQVLAIGRRSVWASCCSVYTGGLKVIAIECNQIQTCSTSGRRRMGPEKALCALAPTPQPSHLGSDPARVVLRKGTKLASGSCFHESETLLGKPSSAPMRVCSGKQRFLVSPLAHCSP